MWRQIQAQSDLTLSDHHWTGIEPCLNMARVLFPSTDVFFSGAVSSCSVLRFHSPEWTQTVFKLGFGTKILLRAKFLLSEFLWVKDYTNHWLESPRLNDASRRLCWLLCGQKMAPSHATCQRHWVILTNYFTWVHDWPSPQTISAWWLQFPRRDSFCSSRLLLSYDFGKKRFNCCNQSWRMIDM